MLDDAYPNFSICGIPYYVSGDVSDWRQLAHRDLGALETTGMQLRLTRASRSIDPDRHELLVTDKSEQDEVIRYDERSSLPAPLPFSPQSTGLAVAIRSASRMAFTCSTRSATPLRSFEPSSPARPSAR